MYYEESLIGGVLMFRNIPNGGWMPISVETQLQRLNMQVLALTKIVHELKTGVE